MLNKEEDFPFVLWLLAFAQVRLVFASAGTKEAIAKTEHVVVGAVKGHGVVVMVLSRSVLRVVRGRLPEVAVAVELRDEEIVEAVLDQELGSASWVQGRRRGDGNHRSLLPGPLPLGQTFLPLSLPPGGRAALVGMRGRRVRPGAVLARNERLDLLVVFGDVEIRDRVQSVVLDGSPVVRAGSLLLRVEGPQVNVLPASDGGAPSLPSAVLAPPGDASVL
mmetsp:Transcript_1022/g.2793  ORF Transcript_1022/g.2793 Transcript_1022/m.2793 type:complete len:220 (-) Transcript_1022:315-974(-)